MKKVDECFSFAERECIREFAEQHPELSDVVRRLDTGDTILIARRTYASTCGNADDGGIDPTWYPPHQPRSDTPQFIARWLGTICSTALVLAVLAFTFLSMPRLLQLGGVIATIMIAVTVRNILKYPRVKEGKSL